MAIQPLISSKNIQKDDVSLLSEDDESILEEIEQDYIKDVIKIDLSPLRKKKSLYPKEKWKTFISFLFLVSNITLNALSLAIVHDRVPDRDQVPPLPDIILDNVTSIDWALNISEYLIVVAFITTLLVIVFHKHRYIILRRFCFILGLLYMLRALTLVVTVVPIASKTYYCSPKSDSISAMVIFKRTWELLSGIGLAINGKSVYCGDYIYSGHTMFLVLSYLTISDYSPRKLFPLHWFSWILSFSGIILLLVAHGHYTIDIILAYFITTGLYWIYHTLANFRQLKKISKNNFLSRTWWFRIFMYFECNVSGPIPRQYDCPFTWSNNNFKGKRSHI